jgi:GT2 family glycosyltransferase
MMDLCHPYFSVIVPTYRRPEQLAVCLRSMTALEYPIDRYEVIVADDGGGESLDAVVRSFGERLQVRLLRRPHVGPSGARNAGGAEAQGEYLAFTADDCMPATNWLDALAARFAVDPDCAVGGRIVNALPDNTYSTATHALIEHLYAHYNAWPGPARFFTPNNLAVPASRYRAMGGFDESFVTATGEDREFCDRWIRHGHRMIYAPEAVVSHTHPLTFRTFFKQHFNYGRGTYRYRKIQAMQRDGALSLEPIPFYLNLLRVSRHAVLKKQKVQLALLLGVSQIANAAGFFWESTESRA